LEAQQQAVFEQIKCFLSSPPVIKAPRRGVPFRLYVATADKFIGVFSLREETEGKEHIISTYEPTPCVC
jgi:hypothetical protein